MEYINMTPHDIVIPSTGDVYARSGSIARSDEKYEAVKDGVLVGFRYEGHNLPAPSEGIGYIVSLPVAIAAKEEGRRDVYIAGKQIRDSEGRIVGCEGLAQL